MATEREGKSRGQQIVDAWNDGRLDDIVADQSDDIRLVAVAPKTSPMRRSVDTQGKSNVRERLQAAMDRGRTFELVSSLETSDAISLVLRDGEGDLFTVALTLDADGRITNLVSLRSK